MIKTIPFKLSFWIFQWMLVLIITFSTYLGYQFYQVTFQAQIIENQRFWVIAQLSQYRSRTDSLSFLSRQFANSLNRDFLIKYNVDKMNQSVLIKRNAELSHPAPTQADLPLVAERGYNPFSVNERVLLNRAMLADDKLRELEKRAFNILLTEKPSTVVDSSIDTILYSGDYIRINLEIMTLINQLLESVNKRFQNKVGEMEMQRAGLVYTIPSILVINLVLLLVSFLFINKRMNKYHGELKNLTIKDFLTGVHNRKYLMETGPLLLSLNNREQSLAAVLMLDIDNFKLINDHYGHDAGDEVLISFSHAVSARLRKGDVFSRFGGEEFVLMLSKVTRSDAESFANELRELLAAHEVPTEQGEVKYTVSIGVVMSNDASNLSALIKRADKALYQAKRAGRNKVVMMKRERFSASLSEKIRGT